MKIKRLMLVTLIGIINVNLAMAGTCFVGHRPGSGPTAVNASTASSICPGLCQKEGLSYNPYGGSWFNNGSSSGCACVCGY